MCVENSGNGTMTTMPDLVDMGQVAYREDRGCQGRGSQRFAGNIASEGRVPKRMDCRGEARCASVQEPRFKQAAQMDRYKSTIRCTANGRLVTRLYSLLLNGDPAYYCFFFFE